MQQTNDQNLKAPQQSPGFLKALLRFAWKNKWLTTIILLLLFTLLLIIITPENQASNTPPPQIATQTILPTNLKTVVFSGTEPELPEEITVFQGSTTPLEVEQFMSDFAQIFGLTASPTRRFFWMDITGEKTLTYNPSQQVVTYLKRQNDYAHESPAFDISRAISTAEQFIKNELSLTEHSAVVDQIEYLGDEGAKTAATAEFLQIPFVKNLHGLPVRFAKSISPPLTISLNHEYEVYRIDMYITTPDPVPMISTTPLTVDQALENIRQNNATIISSSLDLGGIIELQRIESLALTAASLQYRYDPTNNIYYPYYEFIGTAQTDRPGELYTITIVTPAVSVAPSSN